MMPDFCDCDSHGTCGLYDASRFSESEVSQHRQWRAVFNIDSEEFNNLTICYCDPGWTGYSDVGVFQHEAIRSCFINVALVTVMWVISSMCCLFLVYITFRVKLSKRHSTQKSGCVSMSVPYRALSLLTFPIIGVVKLVHLNEPWKATIGITPHVTILYMLGFACFLNDVTETQSRRSTRYFTKVFKDFGFANHIKVEQIRIRQGAKLQQFGISSGCIFYAVSTMQDDVRVRDTAMVTMVFLAVATIFIDVFVIDPRTHARFLRMLKKLMMPKGRKSTNGKASTMVPTDDANEKLNEVYEKVALLQRTKKIRILGTGLLSMAPAFRKRWWRYYGYNVVCMILLFAGLSTALYFVSVYKLSSRKTKMSNKLSPMPPESDVSAFKSSTLGGA